MNDIGRNNITSEEKFEFDDDHDSDDNEKDDKDEENGYNDGKF